MQLWQLNKFTQQQVRNVRQILRGEKLNRIGLGGMTLDADDVVIARHWLEDRSAWADKT